MHASGDQVLGEGEDEASLLERLDSSELYSFFSYIDEYARC